MKKRYVLGMGTGQCGLNLLTDILAGQPRARVTFEQPPLLPWQRRPDRPGIRERLRRWGRFEEDLVGDTAVFYLPYVEDAIAAEPEIRVVCLERPKGEVLAGYCRQIDRGRPLPMNHWSRNPGPGWSQDPMWTPTFPQYETPDLLEGLSCFWDEYHDRSAELARRYPGNVRVVDTGELTTEEGVRALLDFVGIPAGSQVVMTGQKPAWTATEAPSASPKPRPRNAMDPRRCAVLVPFQGFIHHDCEHALEELERRGYHVRRVGGFAAIDQGRNQIATDVLREGYEETLWIDSDVGFHPDDVDKLRSHGVAMVCGIYPQKGKLALASHVMPGTPRMTFGKEGGLVEILFAGAGFLLIRREVYLTVQRQLALPVCNERFDHPMIPYFHPMLRPTDDGVWYLAEDYAFCDRARQCGFKIFADTTIRLWHIGTYRYGWEDAGMERPRFDSFTLNFRDFAPTAATGGTQSDRPFESALADLAAAHPWPEVRPTVPQPSEIEPSTDISFRRALEGTVPPSARLIVEVGAGQGRSTRQLADLAPQSTVVVVDRWLANVDVGESAGPAAEPQPPPLDAFLAESWDYRDRILPIRSRAVDGLRRVADAGLKADVVALTSLAGDDDLAEVLTAALDLFPGASIVCAGSRPGVREVVEGLAAARRLRSDSFGASWRIVRPDF
jgi:hypothetical protein